MDFRRAFSLVELSIVLVILGLLVGGVLTGRSLIHASELRSVTREYNLYYSSVQSFRDKYFALPGDITNATQFWGVLDADPSACVNIDATDARTCDGDGNGLIDESSSTEFSRLWQHLANAGLITGSYTGAGDWGACSEERCPRAKIGSYWELGHVESIFGAGGARFDGNYGHSFRIARLGEYALTPEDAWNVDTKLDDGKPATGKVVVTSANIEDCTDTNDTSVMTAAYLLSVSDKLCGLYLRQQF